MTVTRLTNTPYGDEMRSPDPRVPIALACLAAATVLTAPGAAAATPVRPILLTGPGLATSAVDISPLGVVVANSGPAEAFPGEPAQEARPYRWTPRTDGTWARRALPLPADTTAAQVDGVTNAGAAGGAIYTAAGRTATRWPVSGAPQSIGGPTTQVTAVGPAQMLVETPPPGSFGGNLELVRGDGSRVDIDAVVPDQQLVRGFFGSSVGGRDAAAFGVFGGAGMGSFVQPWIWVAGAGKALPVQSTFFFGNACVGRIFPDGTQAYSGLGVVGEERRFLVGIHVGGVPGTEVELPVPEGEMGRLTCDYGTDAMASDGTVVGEVGTAGSTRAAVWRDGALTLIAPEGDETEVESAAVATRGRVVIVATAADGTRQPYLWKDGVRRTLRLPAGLTLRDVVEFTDSGLVLANLAGADGAVKPVLWRT